MKLSYGMEIVPSLTAMGPIQPPLSLLSPVDFKRDAKNMLHFLFTELYETPKRVPLNEPGLTLKLRTYWMDRLGYASGSLVNLSSRYVSHQSQTYLSPD